MADRRGRPSVRGLAARGLRRAAAELEARSVGGGHAAPPVTVAPSASVGPDVVFAPAPTGGGAPIVVEADAWIGRGARILPGVRIGPGAIVRPYSVVAHDVRPFAVVAGNPAEELERRFDDVTVERLLAVAWWDWSDAERAERAAELAGTDVQAFLARYG